MSVRNEKTASTEALTSEQDALVKAAGAWVQKLSRTIKNSRLYGSRANSVTDHLRNELATALQRLLEEHGPLTLRFTSDDVLTEGVSLYPARSREDNLARPFYRDGIRGLTFSPGIEPNELGFVIDGILKVTGEQSEDDLVTLLWQAQLEHVEIGYVPAHAQMGSSGPASGAGGGEIALWPVSDGYFEAGDGSAPNDSRSRGPIAPGLQTMPWPLPAVPKEEKTAAADPVGETAKPAEQGAGRSDDWEIDGETVEFEADFEQLDSIAAPELERFRARLESESQVSTVAAAIKMARAFLSASSEPGDRDELGRFVPRVLRLALTEGNWREAGEALTLIEECGCLEVAIEGFAEELCQATLVASNRAHLERQGAPDVAEFIGFSKRFGDWTADILGLMLAGMNEVNHQRQLIEALAEECRACPERLAPWLADSRWFVVRHTVQILGAIGGNSIVGLLQAVVEHEEPRVRFEVFAALKGVEPASAKPLLIALLPSADTRLFCSIVKQLARVRDPEVAQLLLGYLTHPDFERQPLEERHAIYSAIAIAGDDEILPELEAELRRNSWFAGGYEPHRQAVANCIAQIGTPAARQILEHGAQSSRAVVRTICESMLVRFQRP